MYSMCKAHAVGSAEMVGEKKLLTSLRLITIFSVIFGVDVFFFFFFFFFNSCRVPFIGNLNASTHATLAKLWDQQSVLAGNREDGK